MESKKSIVCVDLSDYENRKAEITKELMHAGEDVGFFYVCNHGLSQEEIDEAFALNQKYFALSKEIKDKKAVADKSNKSYILGYSTERMSGKSIVCAVFRFFALPQSVKEKKETDRSNKSYVLGYSRRKLETTGILREGFLSGYDHPRMAGLWPDDEDIQGYKEGILKFMRRCHEVTERIMTCFAVGLGLPEDYFKDLMDPKHEDCGTASYNNCYPGVEGLDLPSGMLRIAAHTDFEVLTLLFQRAGQPGLEVCPGKSTTRETVRTQGNWIPCDPMPGCITCNIGDALQYASDDRLKSTYHRVRTPRPDEYKGPRYSMAYFANVRYSTVLQGPKAKYPAITFADILNKKLENEHNKIPDQDIEKFTPEEYLKFQNSWPTGPEFEGITAN